MAISEEWFLDKIILPSSVEFHSLTNARLEAGISSIIERGAGEVHPNFIATSNQRQTIPFTTPELDTLLTNVPLVGASIATGTFYAKKGAVTGRVARATTSHYKVACTTACIYWTTIRLPHNGVGTADVIIVPIYDSSNNPLIYTGSVALSGTISTTDYFGAGPVELNGTAYGDVQEIVVNSGIELYELGGSSEVWNTAIGVRTSQPTIDITFKRQINWGTVGPTGLALDGTNGAIIYGRKFSPDGMRVADATAAHVGVSVLDGRIIPMDTSGDGSNTLSDRCQVQGRVNASSGTVFAVSGATKIDSDPSFSNL